ncbi:hypothetical protein QE152_g38919 [Popillia japonica]|uniref:Uncharacterized protein n=1 Tax=Popillia japonica TaxID=7064 RepID=A0AAW1HW07_POPJA
MIKEAKLFNTDMVSALETIKGYTIDEIVHDEVTLTEEDGSEEIKESVTIVASKQIENVTICRDVELIGEDWFLSKEYILDIDDGTKTKEVHPCQENPKAQQPQPNHSATTTPVACSKLSQGYIPRCTTLILRLNQLRNVVKRFIERRAHE